MSSFTFQTAQEIPAQTALELLQNGATLVDVREPHEVAPLGYGVTPQILLPLSQLEQRIGELPKDQPLIMACLAGGRSMRAAQFLAQNGYTQVLNLTGGISSWMQQGLPVTGPAAPQNRAAAHQHSGGCCGHDHGHSHDHSHAHGHAHAETSQDKSSAACCDNAANDCDPSTGCCDTKTATGKSCC